MRKAYKIKIKITLAYRQGPIFNIFTSGHREHFGGMGHRLQVEFFAGALRKRLSFDKLSWNSGGSKVDTPYFSITLSWM